MSKTPVIYDSDAFLKLCRQAAAKMGAVHSFWRSGGSPNWSCVFEYVTEEERVRQFDDRMRRLAIRYREFPHYDDPTFLAGHARLHGPDLIRRRNEILSANDSLHRPIEFIELLRTVAPEIYERALWEIRALALAERFAAEPHAAQTMDNTPRETPDAWLSRQLRHRHHQAMTSAAFAAAKAQMLTELDSLNLPPDEYERRVAALDEIYADPDPEKDAHNARRI